MARLGKLASQFEFLESAVVEIPPHQVAAPADPTTVNNIVSGMRMHLHGKFRHRTFADAALLSEKSKRSRMLHQTVSAPEFVSPFWYAEEWRQEREELLLRTDLLR